MTGFPRDERGNRAATSGASGIESLLFRIDPVVIVTRSVNPDRMANRRIAYLPYFDETVEKGYTLRMRDAFAAFGTVVRYEGIVATWRRHRGRLDAIVLNWTDNDLLDRRTRTVAARKIVKLFAKTIALRLAARRLVFVRHNVYPHAVAAGHEHDAERWVDRYERLFDVVLTHSDDRSQFAAQRRHYCPHPLYRVVPGLADYPSPLLAEYFVAFGRIVPYKRFERLMAAFPSDRTLVVFGVVGDAAYAASLAALARPNVIFAPGLVSEAEAQAIVRGSQALLIAHADRDVVVSSSFFFAMSLGVPVMAVATPFLRWIAPRVGPTLLRLAESTEALAAMTKDADSCRVADEDHDAIEREFGDAAVHEALRFLLAFNAPRATFGDTRRQTP